MVPKPENEESVYSGDDASQPIMGMVDRVPSTYSNSEGEDCARLAKNGQLDNFTPTRTIKRQDLANLINHDDIDSDSAHRPGRSSFRQMHRSKSEHRGRTTEQVNRGSLGQRAARSNSRGQVCIGDRVIIKDKYIGTCRYVGPIEEHDFQLPEVWYGVELDERLTNNSGIFGSREYFTCAYGHGLMVLGAKVRKVKTAHVSFKNGPSTRTLRPSKSMSNLTSAAAAVKSKTRISVGADQWNSPGRSKNKFSNQHPMATLNRIKQIQAMQQPSFEQNPYGALLQTFNNGSGNSGYACDSLMRKSFERIVSQDHQSDYGLYRNQSLPPMRGQSPEALMANFSTLQRSTSAPQHSNQFTGRRPSFMSTGSGSISQQSVGYTPDQASEKMFYRTQMGTPLCQSCATCSTCMPVMHKQPSLLDYNPAQNQAKQPSTMSLPRQFINRNQSFDYPVDAYQGRKVAFNSSSMSDSSSSSSSGVSSSASSTTGSTSSLDEIITQTQSVEYEKWKSAYGLQRGRSMKKGLAKLSVALQS